MPTPTARELFLDAIGTIGHLYPAPRTLGRALALLRDPDSDVGDIAALIGQDPALAADVLRCANSVIHGGGVRVAAIDEAVQKIGSSQTIHLLGRVVAQGMLRKDLPNYGIDGEAFWAESLFNGIFLEHLARATRALEIDEAYLAGLFRFIGRLAINQTMHAFGAGIVWDGVEPLTAWEQANVGVTCAEAGGILLRRWQISDAVALAVESQDWSESAESPIALVQAVHFTATILPPGLDQAFFTGASDRTIAVPAQDPFARAHGLTDETIADLLALTRADFATVREQHEG